MNFRELCNSIHNTACVVSVRKTETGYDEIRLVDGSDEYVASFKGAYYSKHEFIPNSLYTDYLMRNLNFEEYCYRSAVKKELLHSYGYPEYFKAWMHMLFIPLEYETEELSYCLYIMEINKVFNPEHLSHPSGDIYNQVLNATLQLANTGDFNLSLKNVTREIRKICNASFCCILLVDEVKKELNVLAEDRDLNSQRKSMSDYMSNYAFYDLVQSWDATIADANCIIINDEKGMEYVKEKNPIWHSSLIETGIDSLVLFRLKSGNNQIGYMWVSDFKVDDTPKIKEALEITTFVLGFEIGNHLLMDQLTRLSSVDLLTGLFNRNKLNDYIKGTSEPKDDTYALVFLDLNGLKKVNDLEGHLVGDNLIKRAAIVLKSVFEGSLIFRVGGDEFLVILKPAEEGKIKQLIEDLRKKADENNVSFAVGYSISNCEKDIEKALKEADFNMYQDKRKFYKKK